MMTNEYTAAWANDAKVDYVELSSGRRVRYLKTGVGQPLVLMHTLRTQLDYFQRLIPLLKPRFTVYAVDLPGMGWSDIVPKTGYQEPELRRDMVDFIERLGLSGIILAGESMGATLALTVSTSLGNRVKQVIALNPYDYPQGVERANGLASLIIKMMRLPVFGLIVAKMENALILGGILSGGFSDSRRLPKPFVSELIRSGKRRGYAKVEVEYLHSLGSFISARQLYGRVKVPTLLVYGDHDWSTVAERNEVANMINGKRMVTLQDTGHFASLEHPEGVASLIFETVDENQNA
jgi:pimeloyl-ACP methyl ester carboxylesterase